MIGIVGASGSGKSTLTKLIQRPLRPSEGQIFFDGLDIAQVDPAWLRSHVGVVLQENLLFNRTIHENIALANPALPRAAVMQVARLSGADEFINRLPEGYDTLIEERGQTLGRPASAHRNCPRPRDKSLLDPRRSYFSARLRKRATNQANMRHIVKGRTVIMIAHRLATVRGCNHIIGMADGRIVEFGSHDELVRRPNGVYARLWALQMGVGVEAVA